MQINDEYSSIIDRIQKSHSIGTNNQQLASVRLFHCLYKQKVSFVSQSTNDFHKALTAETCLFAYVMKRKPAEKNTGQCLLTEMKSTY